MLPMEQAPLVMERKTLLGIEERGKLPAACPG